jgi:hypothetical protein
LNACIWSNDRKYRYALFRRFDENFLKPNLVIIGLNPSIADENRNDPTVSRCIKHAFRLGYGGLCMLNIFAFVSTNPNGLIEVEEPVGCDNDKYIKRYCKDSTVVIAWGNGGLYKKRSNEVLKLLKNRNLYCFGITKQEEPRHPLYLKYDVKLKLW